MIALTDNQQDSLNQSGTVMGFPPTLQDNMSHEKIDASPAKIESVSWAKFSALLARQFEPKQDSNGLSSHITGQYIPWQDQCIPGKDWISLLG